jgi:hypothetical protein
MYHHGANKNKTTKTHEMTQKIPKNGVLPQGQFFKQKNDSTITGNETKKNHKNGVLLCY